MVFVDSSWGGLAQTPRRGVKGQLGADQKTSPMYVYTYIYIYIYRYIGMSVYIYICTTVLVRMGAGCLKVQISIASSLASDTMARADPYMEEIASVSVGAVASVGDPADEARDVQTILLKLLSEKGWGVWTWGGLGRGGVGWVGNVCIGQVQKSG
jgi:hypothetical protein